MLNRLKLLFNQIMFLDKFRDEYFDRILGHHKIIAWENGGPVYSLLIPGLMGKAHRISLLNTYTGIMQHRCVPFLANIAVTDKCNCNCASCYFKETRRKDNLLTDQEILDAILQMERIGTSTIQIVGGEPFLRENIIEILYEYFKTKTKSSNIVFFTNGSLLAEKAYALKKTGLNRIFVSLDYTDEARQDKFAGLDGLYAKIISGIREAVRLKFIVGISLVIHNDLTVNDLEDFILFCGKYGVSELYLCREINRKNPVTPVCRYDDIKKFTDKTNSNKKIKTGLNYYQHLASLDGLGGCCAGATRYYIDPYGEVTPCDVLHRGFGNIKNEMLHVIWDRMWQTPGYGAMSGGCRYSQDLEKGRR